MLKDSALGANSPILQNYMLKILQWGQVKWRSMDYGCK